VKIEPLSVCVGHTGTLIIAAAPTGGGAGTTTVSDDGSYLIYKAPAEDGDLTDTVRYTINDGINTSAAADIVVTLTN